MGFLESDFSAATGGAASFGSSRDAILGHGGEDSVALVSKREVSEPCVLKCCMPITALLSLTGHSAQLKQLQRKVR